MSIVVDSQLTRHCAELMLEVLDSIPSSAIQPHHSSSLSLARHSLQHLPTIAHPPHSPTVTSGVEKLSTFTFALKAMADAIKHRFFAVDFSKEGVLRQSDSTRSLVTLTVLSLHLRLHVTLEADLPARTWAQWRARACSLATAVLELPGGAAFPLDERTRLLRALATFQTDLQRLTATATATAPTQPMTPSPPPAAPGPVSQSYNGTYRRLEVRRSRFFLPPVQTASGTIGRYSPRAPQDPLDPPLSPSSPLAPSPAPRTRLPPLPLPSLAPLPAAPEPPPTQAPSSTPSVRQSLLALYRGERFGAVNGAQSPLDSEFSGSATRPRAPSASLRSLLASHPLNDLDLPTPRPPESGPEPHPAPRTPLASHHHVHNPVSRAQRRVTFADPLELFQTIGSGSEWTTNAASSQRLPEVPSASAFIPLSEEPAGPTDTSPRSTITYFPPLRSLRPAARNDGPVAPQGTNGTAALPRPPARPSANAPLRRSRYLSVPSPLFPPPTSSAALEGEGSTGVTGAGNGSVTTPGLGSGPQHAFRLRLAAVIAERDALLARVQMLEAQLAQREAIARSSTPGGGSTARPLSLGRTSTENAVSVALAEVVEAEFGGTSEGRARGERRARSDVGGGVLRLAEDGIEELELNDDDDDRARGSGSGSDSDSEVEYVDGRGNCVCCYEEPCRVLFLPCSHCVTCEMCSRRLTYQNGGNPAGVRCPLCRTVIEGSIKVFFA